MSALYNTLFEGWSPRPPSLAQNTFFYVETEFIKSKINSLYFLSSEEILVIMTISFTLVSHHDCFIDCRLGLQLIVAMD